jgi:hypothetical protein
VLRPGVAGVQGRLGKTPEQLEILQGAMVEDLRDFPLSTIQAAQRCLDEQTIKALKALLVRKAQERHARGEISDEKLADYITRYTEEATQ